MKIGIFDPYLDTLGGGEKYILDIANCLAQDNEVLIFWDDPLIKKEWERRFNKRLESINIAKNIFSNKNNLFKRFFQTKDYDLIIYVSDGSIPLLFGKKNILIFQFPIPGVNGRNLVTKIKLKKIDSIICYSNFVKSFIDKQYGFKSKVIPPYVDSPIPKDTRKENIILTVGRFTKGMNTKKQEILIDRFKNLYDEGITNWRLVLIGSHLPGDEDFIQKLKNKIKKYPISLLTNISYDELSDYYQKAKIYWHATGFGEDLYKYPERAEHFGISTIEAMGVGVVPVVINAGGQKEIVQDGKNGYLWDSLEGLMTKTNNLIKDKDLWEKMSKAAIKRSKMFSKNIFCNNLRNIIE